MKLKKIRKILAQFLIVALMMPNLNVKAVTNESTTAIESTTVNEEATNEITTVIESDNTTTQEEAIEEISDNNNSIEEIKDTNEESVTPENQNENEVTEINQVNNNIENESTETIKGKTYEKKKAINVNARIATAMFSLEEGEEDKEEFRLKQEAMNNLEVLVPMTDSEYELTIANSDGSFEYLESFDDIDSAVNAANSISENSLDESQLPAVINARGQVVYSTNEMARILRHVNNSNVVGNVNVYPNASLASPLIVVNQGYIDDVPILDVYGNATKIMVNGYEGWINNNRASGNYDMIVVPLNQASNPSYYTVRNGELIHFISYDLTGTTGFEKILGKAPSILREGVRYLSYDGQYFYSYDHTNQNGIVNGLNTLISDYKAGVRTNSVNNGNPYYVYYQYLPFRSQTIYTAADLNNFINNHPRIKGTSSKLKDLGQAFKDAETQYGVNALLALAVAINESGYGNSEIAKDKNNLFGLNAVDASPGLSADSFATPRDSVIDFAKNWISRGYADPADWRYYGGFVGNKYRGANVKYASDPFWGEKAASFAYEIDKTLSAGSSSLRDTNSKQIGVVRANNQVINKNGTLLYNTTVDTSVIISDLQQVVINGKTCYEIYPERNTSTLEGKYHGNYNWNDRAYIEASNISLVNVFTPPLEIKYGLNRYSTAVELSKSSFTSAETIVISNGYAIPDGLAATPIASHYKSPLLLVEKSSIPSETQNEIKRLGAKNVIIIGGTSVVDKNVEAQLNNLGISRITRLGGATRYETAIQVARYIDQNLYDIQNVVIANGYGEPDALSIAPVSGRDKMPIILVESNSIPTEAYNWMRDASLNNAYIIGGTTAVSNNVLNSVNALTRQDISGNRLGGSTRYETNAIIIDKFYGSITENVYITEGLELADALSAGPVSVINNSPVVICEDGLTPTQKSIFANKTTNKIIQVGGKVSKASIQNLRELLSRTR